MSLTRHKPLTAHTPLARSKGLARTSPLRRGTPLTTGSSLRGTPAPPKRPTGTGPSRAVTDLVLARAGDRCERCGGPLDGLWGYSKQHRVPRGSGGSSLPYINQVSNLAVLCGSATTGCHGDVESNRRQAEADGWVVRHPKPPAQVPVRLWDGRRVWLSDDGRYLDAPPGGDGMTATSPFSFPAQMTGENRTRCLDGSPGSLPVPPSPYSRRSSHGLGGHRGGAS